VADQRVFLGWAAKPKPSPLTAMRDDPETGRPHLAATWPYGPGGAPHMLVVGTTGGGKSSLLRLMLLDLVSQPGRRGLVIIDGEGAGEFTMFRRAPNVAAIVNSNEKAYPGSVRAAKQAFTSALAEIVDRNADLTRAQEEAEQTRRTPAYTPPAPLFVVVDGWMPLIYDIGRTLGAKARDEAVGDAIQAARLGRKVDVHLVFGTHRPDARSVESGLPGELKALLPCRVAAVGPLGLRKVEAEMAFDDSTVKDRVPSELGGCMLQVGNTEVAFRAPRMVNPTTADPAVDDAARAAVWRRLPRRTDAA
jgi:energy-coupling factor transporter ATP-binding protein EcfA2